MAHADVLYHYRQAETPSAMLPGKAPAKAPASPRRRRAPAMVPGKAVVLHQSCYRLCYRLHQLLLCYRQGVVAKGAVVMEAGALAAVQVRCLVRNNCRTARRGWP